MNEITGVPLGRTSLAVIPSDLGFFEKRPGSGIWYRAGDKHTYEPRVCEFDGQPYMGLRDKAHGKPGGQAFCSPECRQRAQVKDKPAYITRHWRVGQARGSASDQSCVGCGEQAAEWSQIHGTTGNEPEHYEPRCKQCHEAYDLALKPRGEKHGNAVFTEDQIRAIRAADGIGSRELARKYGVNRTTIQRIRSGRTWGHVE